MLQSAQIIKRGEDTHRQGEPQRQELLLLRAMDEERMFPLWRAGAM